MQSKNGHNHRALLKCNEMFSQNFKINFMMFCWSQHCENAEEQKGNALEISIDRDSSHKISIQIHLVYNTDVILSLIKKQSC